jgi:hypothetical protein
VVSPSWRTASGVQGFDALLAASVQAGRGGAAATTAAAGQRPVRRRA